MAIVKGICKNIENCDKAENKEIQDIEKSAAFVCEECGKPLVPAFPTGGDGGGGGSRLWLWVVIAVVVLAGGGAGYYFYSSGDTEPITVLTEDETVTTEEPVSEPPTAEPEAVDATVTLQSCLNEGTLIDNNNGTGSISTPYGKYEGDLKNGKANGNGTFQFFKTCRISKRDNQERSGETGDYLVGQFADNEVISAKWLDKEKEQKGTVIIGQSGV